MISTVVLDLDGTLIDSVTLKRQAFQEIVCGDPDGRERMSRALVEAAGDRYAVFAAYLTIATNRSPCRAQIEELVRRYSEKVDPLVAAAPELPGASQLLQWLVGEHIAIYMNSSTPLPSLNWILAQRGWTDYFSGVFGSPVSKRESIAKIQTLSGARPSDMAVVGDGIDDRRSADSVGCRFFYVGDPPGALHGAPPMSLRDVLRLLSAQRH